jgi:hypothetical protein
MGKQKALDILKILSKREIDYQRAVSLSIQEITEDEQVWIRQILIKKDSIDSLTEDEINWIKQRCKNNEFEYNSLINLPPNYIRTKKRSLR